MKKKEEKIPVNMEDLIKLLMELIDIIDKRINFYDEIKSIHLLGPNKFYSDNTIKISKYLNPNNVCDIYQELINLKANIKKILGQTIYLKELNDISKYFTEIKNKANSEVINSIVKTNDETCLKKDKIINEIDNSLNKSGLDLLTLKNDLEELLKEQNLKRKKETS